MPKLNNRSRKFLKLNKTHIKTNLSKKNPRAHKKVYLKTNSILHTLYGGSGNNKKLREKTQLELDEEFKYRTEYYINRINFFTTRLDAARKKFDIDFTKQHSYSSNQNIDTFLKVYEQAFQATDEYKKYSKMIDKFKEDKTQNYEEYYKNSSLLKVLEEGRQSALNQRASRNNKTRQQQQEKEERRQRQQEDADRRQQEDADRRQQEEADRRQQEDADRRQQQQEADRRQQEEADRRQQEEADRRQQQKKNPRGLQVYNANTGHKQ